MTFATSPITLDISIHALREESDVALEFSSRGDRPISIHALREESDPERVGRVVEWR